MSLGLEGQIEGKWKVQQINRVCDLSHLYTVFAMPHIGRKTCQNPLWRCTNRLHGRQKWLGASGIFSPLNKEVCVDSQGLRGKLATFSDQVSFFKVIS